MLNNRQCKILNYLFKMYNSSVFASEFQKQFDVSTRTIQSDISAIRNCIKNNGAIIESNKIEGYKLIIKNEEKFKLFLLEENRYSENHDFNNQENRITYILKKLFSTNKYIQSETIAKKLSISNSRFSNDLRQVRNILRKYNLKISQKPNYGIKIEGSEKDRRLCIIKEKVDMYGLLNTESEKENELIKDIGEILIDVFFEKHYKISDIAFQNLVLHSFIAVKRIQENCIIEEIDNENITFGHELDVADEIMEKLQEKFLIIVPRNEVIYLAINLKGKRSYTDSNVISEEINELVICILESISNKLLIDLSSNIELRISLALHITPLITRAKFNHMIKNRMAEEIHQTFPLAFDAAVIGIDIIKKKYYLEFDESEISYLAIHFVGALQDYYILQKPKKILILCSSGNGETLLLRYKFLSWFKELVSELKIINFIELSRIDISDYDLIFATSLVGYNVPENTIKINYFLNDKDYTKIQKALLGESDKNKIIGYFEEQLFSYELGALRKEELIFKMSEKAQNVHKLTESLYDSVIKRELLGFTAIGNFIAVPHPDHLFSPTTFVATTVLNKPIQWDDSMVQIIFLICVSKDQEKDLKSLYEYIAFLVSNEKAIKKIIKKPTYDNFISVFEKL